MPWYWTYNRTSVSMQNRSNRTSPRTSALLDDVPYKHALNPFVDDGGDARMGTVRGTDVRVRYRVEENTQRPTWYNIANN